MFSASLGAINTIIYRLPPYFPADDRGSGVKNPFNDPFVTMMQENYLAWLLMAWFAPPSNPIALTFPGQLPHQVGTTTLGKIIIALCSECAILEPTSLSICFHSNPDR
jgi:hypothetical protein